MYTLNPFTNFYLGSQKKKKKTPLTNGIMGKLYSWFLSFIVHVNLVSNLSMQYQFGSYCYLLK